MKLSFTNNPVDHTLSTPPTVNSGQAPAQRLSAFQASTSSYKVDSSLNEEYTLSKFEQMQILWKAINEPSSSSKKDAVNLMRSKNEMLLKCAELGHWQARSMIGREIANNERNNPLGSNLTTAIVWFKKALAAYEQRLNTDSITTDSSEHSVCQEMYSELLQIKDDALDSLLEVKLRPTEHGSRPSTPVWEPNAKEIENLEHSLRNDESPALDRLKAGRTLADNFFERGLHKKAVSYYKETLKAMPTEAFAWEIKG